MRTEVVYLDPEEAPRAPVESTWLLLGRLDGGRGAVCVRRCTLAEAKSQALTLLHGRFEIDQVLLLDKGEP